MAVIVGDQVRKVYSDDGPRRWALFQVLNITTGDTVDMSNLGHFRIVKQASFMGATVSGIAQGTVSAGATVTVPAGLAADSAYMLVDGIPT